jgi:hypothetical protein
VTTGSATSPSPTLVAEIVLDGPEDRRWRAERWIEEVLAGWDLQPAVGGRWLSPADLHLRAPGALRLRAEYEPALFLCSLEIWSCDRRVFGLDDWVGPVVQA